VDAAREQAAAPALETPQGGLHRRDGTEAQDAAEEDPGYAERHHGQGLAWPAVCREDACALRNILNSGLFALVCADVLRPSLHWQLTRTSTNLRAIICRHRDLEGFARLQETVGPEAWSSRLGILAKNVLVRLVIAKGGGLADINVGDAIEYMEAHRERRATSGGQSLFYSWLKDVGHLPPDASASLRSLHRTSARSRWSSSSTATSPSPSRFGICWSSTSRNASPPWITRPWRTRHARS
jgi:hypothetical protein